MRYRITKQEPDGTIYEIERNSDAELVLHLQSTFENTKHVVIAIINITHTEAVKE